MDKPKNIITLFLTMMKIGLFTFGGGYAMLALLENEFVSRKKWLDKDEFLNMAAIAESTPGPIAINAATYIGYKNAGVAGAIFATLGMCIPSFVIIYIISLFFDAFLAFSYVEYAFRGIQVGVIYLILSAGMKMLKGVEKNTFNYLIIVLVSFTMVLFSVFAVNFSTIYFILISGTAAVAVHLISEMKKEKNR